MNVFRFLIGLALLILIMEPRAWGDEFQDANRAYIEGEYAVAIEGYESLIEQGLAHEDLFYNLGNAYFREGRLGPSIFNYERALRLNPDLEDAIFNLNLARDVVTENVDDQLIGIQNEPTWVKAALFFSKKELVVSFLLCNGLLFGLLIFRFVLSIGFFRSFISVSILVVGVLWIMSAWLLNRQEKVQNERHQAIVLSEQVYMREAPNPRSAERGQLHPGLNVRILDRQKKWAHIRLSNGVEGWVPGISLGEF